MAFFNWSSADASKKIDAAVAECEHNLIKYSLQHARLLKLVKANPSGPMRMIIRSRLIDLTRAINAAELTLKECSNHRMGISGIETKRKLANLSVAAISTIANAQTRTLNPKTRDKALVHFDDAPGDESREIGAAAEAYLGDAAGESDSAVISVVDKMMELAMFTQSEPTNNDPPQPPPVIAEPAVVHQRVGVSMQ